MTLLSIIIAIAIIAFLVVARPRIFHSQPSVPVTNIEDALKIKQDATKSVEEIKQRLEGRQQLELLTTPSSTATATPSASPAPEK